MHGLRDFLRLIRFAQTELSVRYHRNDIARAQLGLDKALRARDAALADLRIAGVATTRELPRDPPSFLLKSTP
jgi:hypothetical protein